MNMGNFSWNEQGKKLQLCYHLDEREIVDARGVGQTAEQEIDGLVPYLFTSAMGMRTFIYQVGKRATVTGTLASIISKAEFLTLCQNVIDSLVRLQQRGTDTQKLVYHTSCVFLNKKTLRPEWVYLPLREYDAPESALGDLLTELVFQAKLGNQEDGAYIRQLLDFLQANPMAELAALKQLIEQLLQQAVFDTQFKTQTSKKGKKQKRSKKKEQPVGYPPPPVGIPGSGAPPVFAGRQQFAGQPAFGVGRGPSVGSIEPFPSRETAGQTSGRLERRGLSAFSEKGSTGTGFDLLYRQMAAKPAAAENISSETVVLGEAEEGTTVLGAGAGTNTAPRLIRCKTGETISIGSARFCLGKGKNGTDYIVADNSAISRNHVCILCQNGEYFAQDQHSTNHTYINGVQVSPEVPGKLSDGDTLTLANEDFRFEILGK